jgi:hypothetical protein
MYKVIHLIKRKSHLTHEQFREHFERSHAPMALKFCGHLFKEYRRNYVNVVFGGDDSRKPVNNYGPMEWDWDLLSEWIVESEEDLYKIFAIMESGEYKHYFVADEDRFIDRTMNVMMPCAVGDTGVAFDPKNTVFDTVTGEPSWDGYENWKPLERF